MKQVYFIRHAESLSNIGGRTGAHNTIPLTELGELQAKELVDRLPAVPELIVVSPFTRTQDTAKHVVEKYDTVPVEIWNVEEITYLDPSTCIDTTREDRAERVEAYWNNLDIHYSDGGQAESFYDFIMRIKKAIVNLSKRPEKTIFVFSHGVFIYNLYQYIERNKINIKEDLDENMVRELMIECRRVTFSGESPIKNVSIHPFIF